MKKGQGRIYPEFSMFLYALWMVLGKKTRRLGAASLYEQDIKAVRKPFLSWIKKVRKRCLDVSNLDLTLRDNLIRDLDNLEERVKLIGKEEVEWEIIPILMRLNARLLGFDWHEGIINRNVIFYQTKEQEKIDERYQKRPKFRSSDEIFKEIDDMRAIEKEIVLDLYKRHLSVSQISSIVNLSQNQIKKLLNTGNEKH